jgi:hypothetical protein
MGWIVVVLCLLVLGFLGRKAFDRETTRNLKGLGKVLAYMAAFFLLLALFIHLSK